MQQPLGAPKRTLGNPGGSSRPPGPLGAPGGSSGGGDGSRTLLFVFIGALALAGVLAIGALLIPRVLDGDGDDDGPDAVSMTVVASAPTATTADADTDTDTEGDAEATTTDAVPTDAATATVTGATPLRTPDPVTAVTATAPATHTTTATEIEGITVGPARDQPAPLGMRGISSNGEWVVTLLEQYRGAEAYARLVAANQFNEPAPEGMQYLLVYVEVTFHGSASDPDAVQEVDYASFSATGERGVRWQWPGVVEPEPVLRGELRAGETLSGWAALLAGADERDLLLFFEPFLSDVEADEIFMALDADASVTPVTADLAQADEAGLSPEMAVVIGQPVTTMTWEVRAERFVSGDAALRMLQEDAVALEAPPEGEEYLLVEISARNISAEFPSALLVPDIFAIQTGDGETLVAPPVLPPDPELWYEVYTGGEVRGWIVLTRPLDDQAARLVLLPMFDASAEQRYFLLPPSRGVALID